MPAETRWLADQRLILISHHGTVTLEDLEATDAAALARNAGEGAATISDFRRCDLVLSKEDVSEYARRMESSGLEASHPGLRVAMITEDPRGTALGLLFRRKPVGMQMEIFSTAHGAWNFVGVDPAIAAGNEDLIPAP